MQIEKLELENIKPFKKQTFVFSNGINVLSGPNGSGKSTVFEAIGYALFGVDAEQFIGNSKRFVRKGQKRGCVMVHFTANDGQRYRIERWAGASAKWLLAKKRPDESLEALELKDDELRLQLKKLLNLRSDQPLNKQFLNVIGPLQNDFLGPFIKKGRQRTDEFDNILGINTWRKAFEQSREIEKEAEHIIRLREEAVASKTTQVADYDDVVTRLKAAEQRRTTASASLAQITEQLAQIRQRHEELSALARTLQAQQEVIHKKNQELSARQATAQEAERSLTDAYKAKVICDGALEGYRAYEQAEQQLAQLKEKQKLATRLEKEIQGIDNEIASLQARIEADEKNLREREQEARAKQEQLRAELTETETLAEAYELAHVRALEEYKTYRHFARGLELIVKPSSVGERILRSIEDLAGVIADTSSLKQRLETKPVVDARARQEKELAADYHRVTESLLALQARRQQLEDGNVKLAGGLCPFFEEKCLNLESKGLAPTNFFAQQIETLQGNEAETRQRLEQVKTDFDAAQKAAKDLVALHEVESQLKKANERVARARAQLQLHLAPLLPGGSLWEGIHAWVQSAPSIAYAEELRRQLDETVDFHPVEDLPVLKSEVGALIERYNGLITKLKRATDERGTHLENAVRKVNADLAMEQQRIAGLKNAEREVEGALGSIAQGRSRLDANRRTLAAKLQEYETKKTQARAYKDLDAEIKKQEDARVANKEHYTNFLSHQKAAREVAELERRHAALRAQAADLGRARDEIVQRVEALRASYDEAAHHEMQRQSQVLERDRGALTSELSGLERDITRLQEQKAHMENLFKEISHLSAEVKAYKKTLSFIKDLRGKVLNEVSEKLSQRFREEIGQSADRIYRIISRSDEELRWGDGYNVMLVDLQEGQERVRYDEELSGGQMMSAVVALRLALLQTSGSRMGFFDEPTSNLDEARRLNLVQAFRSLDAERGAARQPWYEQLFLISHDVTFTEITDQTIHFVDPGVVLNQD